jgi:hypothetical protein
VHKEEDWWELFKKAFFSYGKKSLGKKLPSAKAF